MNSQDQNFCVYVHSDSNGIVRYVGSGRLLRANNTKALSNRGKRYADFVTINGKLNVDVIESGLTKLEATEKEALLYSIHKSDMLLNTRSPVYVVSLPDKTYLNSILYYDESSPSCLRWKVCTGRGVKVDGIAGSLSSYDGYWKVQVAGVSYKAHRIVLALHGVVLTQNDIVDHIDNNRSNNSIKNLRISTYAENGRNKVRSARNRKFPVGVIFRKIKGVEYFVATVTDSNRKTLSGQSKLIRRHFRVSTFGHENALMMASDARKAMLSELETLNNVKYSNHHK